MADRNHIEEIAALEGVFRDEAIELLEKLEACLLDLESEPNDQQLVEAAFRNLHTLKGIAAMYGFDHLSRLSHGLESFFEGARRAPGVAVQEDSIRFSLESLDCMRALASVRGSETEISARAEADKLLADMSHEVEDAAKEEGLCGRGAHDGPSRVYRMRIAPGSDAFFRGLRPESILKELCTLGPCDVQADVSSVPSLGEIDPGALYLAWDVELVSAEAPERVREALMFLHGDEFQVECEEHAGAAGGHGPESLSERPQPGKSERRRDDRREGPRRARDVVGSEDTVRVPAQRLDQLVDMVGELVTAQGALAALSAEVSVSRLSSVAEEIGRLVGVLREGVLDIRMVPIGTLFGRFRRHVRDLAGELGKDVDIVAEGAETEMDKGVLDRIGEPVLHILRNCIDHGIEAPDERLAAGKPRRGTIRLSAFQSGGLVHLSVVDDGRGLSPEKVRARAVAAGLVAPDAELTEEEMTGLLFSSGFSTSDSVTAVSGRGVGLDVVKRTLDELNGSIALTSVIGEGTEIRLSVPLTLAIIDGLLATVGDERYVIPLAVVESCAEVGQPEAWREHGRELLDVHGSLVPLVRLRSFFGVEDRPADDEIAVISSVDGKRFGIVVDSVQDTIQAVIKPFGRYVRRAEGLSGTTVLGDGSAVAVVDPGDLLHAAEADGQALSARH